MKTVEELVEILKESKLADYEIAEAIQLYLAPKVSKQIEYEDITRLHKISNLVAFYLAAKHFSE